MVVFPYLSADEKSALCFGATSCVMKDCMTSLDRVDNILSLEGERNRTEAGNTTEKV